MKEKSKGQAGGAGGVVKSATSARGGRSTRPHGQTTAARGGCKNPAAGCPSKGSVCAAKRAGMRPAQNVSVDPFAVQVGIPQQYWVAFGLLPLDLRTGLLETIHVLGLAINKYRLLDAVPGMGRCSATGIGRGLAASKALLRAALREVDAANDAQRSKVLAGA